MSSEQRFNDRDIIERYTDQPSQLPGSLRRAVTGTGTNDAEAHIAAYALADLDEKLALARTWVVLSTRELVIAKERPNETHELARVPRGDVTKVELATGLSCHLLRVYGESPAVGGAAPLLELRFTHRQRRSMEGMAFLLEQVAGGSTLETRDADATYLQSVAQPIREAQALDLFE